MAYIADIFAEVHFAKGYLNGTAFYLTYFSANNLGADNFGASNFSAGVFGEKAEKVVTN